MKWSNYNFYWKKSNGNTLIYNSLEEKLAILNQEPMCSLEEVKEELPELLKNGFVFDGDEKGKALYLSEKVKYSGDTLEVWIYVTNSCNFKCIYCFENSTCQANASNDYMSKNTVLNVVTWICGEAKRLNCSKVKITYIGGEPLLNIQAIKVISEQIREHVEIESKFSIITNGYLLSEENIILLRHFGVDRFQITIDGPANVHNKRRMLKGEQGTFDVIMNNVHRLLNLIGNVQICIRINCDKYNMEYIKILIRMLYKQGLVGRVTLDLGEVVLCGAQGDKELRTRILAVSSYAQDLGFGIAFSRLNRCWKYTERWILIATDGNVYKCPMEMDNNEYRVASVNNQEIYNLYYQDMIKEVDASCVQCNLFGVCGGGCSYTQMNNKKKACNKTYLEKLITLKYSNYFEKGV